jgi:hypothetical protein
MRLLFLQATFDTTFLESPCERLYDL